MNWDLRCYQEKKFAVGIQQKQLPAKKNKHTKQNLESQQHNSHNTGDKNPKLLDIWRSWKFDLSLRKRPTLR